MTARPCQARVGGLLCGMPDKYPTHEPPPKQGTDTPNPAYAYHEYDPGERRRLVRRMVDRIRVIEDANRLLGADR